MSIGGGFGPSSGRLVEVTESSEARLKRNTRPLPPAASALALAGAFLMFVIGLTLVYDHEILLGSVLVLAGVVLVVLPIWWILKTREQ